MLHFKSLIRKEIGWVWWLMPVFPALWETMVEGMLEPRSSRPDWATWLDPISIINVKQLARHGGICL